MSWETGVPGSATNKLGNRGENGSFSGRRKKLDQLISKVPSSVYTKVM